LSRFYPRLQVLFSSFDCNLVMSMLSWVCLCFESQRNGQFIILRTDVQFSGYIWKWQ
jgi:hypothetical protein